MTDPDEWTVPDCQVCGQPIKTWRSEYHYLERLPSAPAWEGGPLMEDPFAPVGLIPNGYTFTANECGHVQDDHSKLVWIHREKATSEAASGGGAE